VDQINTITAENASVNSTMAREVERKIPHFKSATHILGCVAHVINLAAKIGISALGSLDNQFEEGEDISLAAVDLNLLEL